VEAEADFKLGGRGVSTWYAMREAGDMVREVGGIGGCKGGNHGLKGSVKFVAF